MRRRLANAVFWSLAVSCAVGAGAFFMPDRVSASTKTWTCAGGWGPHQGQCSCRCIANGWGTLYKFTVKAKTYLNGSGSSTGYTNVLSPSVAPSPPAGIAWYDGASTRTRVNCTDTDINWAQIDSGWGTRVWSPQTANSQSWCPVEAPIAYETFCQVKGYCSAYTGL